MSPLMIENLVVSRHHQNKYYLVLVFHKLMASTPNLLQNALSTGQEISLFGNSQQEIKQK